jgi:excisionase family DNA binding protein
MQTDEITLLPKKSYSIPELMAVSGFGRNKVYRLIAEGRLRTFKHGKRRFVSAQALDECIRALEAETEAAA